jgi:UV DNA damage endonuclease
MSKPKKLPQLPTSSSQLRLGLCCLFLQEPIRFRTTTATACARLDLAARQEKLAELCRSNAAALLATIQTCTRLGIGSFRINSQILPVKTHPVVGYDLRDLPGGDAITEDFRKCGRLASKLNVRLTFHPDQFVVLNSPRETVVESSLAEIEYQSEVAEWVGADVVNIHGGGAYDSRSEALERFSRNLDRLSPRARERLTVENDDKIYTVEELLPLCRRKGVPLVYDVHHHRCHGDGLSIDEASELAAATWNREPLFHISSPKLGWDGGDRRRHHDFIDVADFPGCWRGKALTVEVEAKAKELAIARLQCDLQLSID